MLDDMVDYIERIRERPVWQPIPREVRERFHGELPAGPSDLAAVHEEFTRYILPYAAGNVHPGFMGWVHGGGTPVGMVAEMLAGGLNANLGGRDHIPIEVERQVAEWMRKLFGFPESATGLFVTGASVANLVGVLVARDTELGFETRCAGVGAGNGAWRRTLRRRSMAASRKPWISPASEATRCAGSRWMRRYRIDLGALRAAIDADRRAGFTPFLVVGTAGTVDTGAIDDLEALADLARAERLWFHVDGACGALAMLSPELAPRLKGIERADSLAFDFHKWGQVPYDAGFVLVRDGVLHRQTLRQPRRLTCGGRRRGWPPARSGRAISAPIFRADFARSRRGSRSRYTARRRWGRSIARTCELARYLAEPHRANARIGAGWRRSS